eukprot:s160_g7.t1
MARLGRDELLELRGQHTSPSAEPLHSPKCLLVPGSLVAAPTDVATLDPITAKFVLAFTTTCRGERVELRPTAQSAPRGPAR